MISLSPQDMEAVGLSVQVATLATLLALPVGFGVAFVLVFCRLPGKSVLEGIVNLPLVLPPVVTGYLLLLLLGNSGPFATFFDRLGLDIVFTIKGAVIASAVVGFPLLVRSIRIGLEAIDREYLQAADTLGANWWDRLVSIILPLSSRAIMAGMSLAFARSLGEFGATIILAGNIPGLTQTIPLAIYEYTSMPGGDQMALSLCLASVVLSFLVLLISESAGKKLSSQG